MVQMSILSALIVVLGMILVALPLSNRLGLGKSAGIIAVGIVLSLMGLHELPNLAPSFTSHDALISQGNLSDILLIAGSVICFSLGLQIHPLSLFNPKQQGLIWPAFQYLLVFMLLSILLGLMGLLAWPKLIAVAGVCGLGSIVLFSTYYREATTQPRSLQQQYRERYWLNPSLKVQGLLFIVLFMVLPILDTPNQPIRHIAHIMAMVMLLSGGLLLTRYAINPLCQYYQRQQSSLVWLCIVLFILSFLWLGQSLGLHLLITAVLCGMVLSEGLYSAPMLHMVQQLHPIILVALWLALCMMIDWQAFNVIGAWLIAGIFAVFLLKWIIGFGIARWQTGQWQEATTRAFHQLTLSEFAALLVLFASPSLFTESIMLPKGAQEFPLQQWLLIGIVLSVFLHAILTLLHTHVIDPLFQHIKFKSDRTLETSLEPNAPSAPVIVIGFGRVGQIITRILHVHQQTVYVLDNTEIDLNELDLAQVHFIQGDATQAETLAKLPLVADARVMLCIDDIEDSLTAARYLHLHHPEIKLMVRARDRAHAHILKQMGIEQVWRETYSTALDMTDQVLADLGLTDQIIAEDRATFMQHDEHLFHMQHLSGVTMTYTSTQYNEPLAELKWLFEADAERLQVKPLKTERSLPSDEPPSAAS